MYIIAQTSGTQWAQLFLDGGILISLITAIFATGKWVGSVGKELTSVRHLVEEIKTTTSNGIKELANRITPLERDFWRRRGRDEGMAEAQHREPPPETPL
jgi:hypothetical protein